jgi:hypothetical protein
MTELTIDDLSPAESELLVDFVEWVGEFDRQMLDKQSIEADSDKIGIQEAFEFLAPFVSKDTSEFDVQMFRFFRLEQQTRSGKEFEYEHEEKLPNDAAITPEELNRFLNKDELEELFILSSQMIETLTIELVMEKVVDESRKSKSVRQKIERKSQREREWLLHVTGVISDGEKGEIRRIYELRSSIVHASENSTDFLKEINTPSDIDRAKSAINSLHEKVYDTKMKHRFGDLLV